MISVDALKVLADSVVEDNSIKLTSPQLDRKLYLEVNEIITRLGGKWNKKQRSHIFDNYIQVDELINEVIDSGLMPEKNALAFFRTPQSVAEKLVALVKKETISFLEPSAGDGAIVDVIKNKFPNAQINLFELDPSRSKALTQKGYKVTEGDFLIQPVSTVQAVVMNPPFSVKGDCFAYITHIMKAWEWLEKDGQLIAITPPSFAFRSDKKSVAFKNFVENYGYFENLLDGTFKESGTQVNTAMIVLHK